MNKQTKTLLLTITVAIAALPVAGYALAQSAPRTAPALTSPLAQTQQNDAETNDAETNDGQDPAIQGSIALPGAQNGAENGTEIADAQETAQYQSMARITPAQASAAAQAVVPGTVTNVQLGDENGFLIYDVVIGNRDVIIDAGNARVLAQGGVDASENESGNENDNEGGEDGN